VTRGPGPAPIRRLSLEARRKSVYIIRQPGSTSCSPSALRQGGELLKTIPFDLIVSSRQGPAGCHPKCFPALSGNLLKKVQALLHREEKPAA